VISIFAIFKRKGESQTMDLFGAIAAFFNFASTPAGQQMMTDFRAVDNAIGGKIKDLFDHLHGQVVKADAPQGAK
jgi:hypothetical protein